jgi:hypothetical protein
MNLFMTCQIDIIQVLFTFKGGYISKEIVLNLIGDLNLE